MVLGALKGAPGLGQQQAGVGKGHWTGVRSTAQSWFNSLILINSQTDKDTNSQLLTNCPARFPQPNCKHDPGPGTPTPPTTPLPGPTAPPLYVQGVGDRMDAVRAAQLSGMRGPLCPGGKLPAKLETAPSTHPLGIGDWQSPNIYPRRRGSHFQI